MGKEKKEEKKKKYLIITSSGGGGHTNAAEARKKELLDLGIPEKEIDIIDLMGIYGKSANAQDGSGAWVPTYSLFGLDPLFSGAANTEKWNASQKEGTEEAVRKLEYLVEMQPLAESMQAKDVKRNLTTYLKEHDVQEVFNTQALSTPAICQAVVDYNNSHVERKLNILTTVTDLITHRAEHFLSSLKNLTPDQQKVLKMEIAAAPMCDPGEKEAEFYKEYQIPENLFVAKSPLKKVNGRLITEAKVGEYPSPVKQEYLKTPSKQELTEILIKAEGPESEYISSKLPNASVNEKDITITKALDDRLITITMGSQGSNSVIEYMDQFADQLLDLKDIPKGNIYLCIAAGKSGEGSLYEKVKTHAQEIMYNLPKELKERVKILPLAFQDAKHMASLLNNSDVLISRSGGMSSMEAEATNGRNPNRKVYVHSEAKLKYPDNFPKHSYDATYEALMTGTVKWEGGNAEYLLRNIGASLGSPETVDFGFTSPEGLPNAKENSLFHFAYDGKLEKNNLAKIEKLIREGSNPNLRFAGGSYLIDHCKDFETKQLLVIYGAKITERGLEGLDLDQVKIIRKLEKEFNSKGAPEKPFVQGWIQDLEKEAKAHSYLYPFTPKNKLEKLIVGMDKVGEFIKSKVLRVNDVHNALDSMRMYLETDPTEKRNPVKRLKEARNFLFNTTVFIAKQPVNMITKPISFVSNVAKMSLIGAGTLINEAEGKKSNICNYKQIKETGKKALTDLKDSLISWGTAALVVSGFGAPVSLAIFGATGSISLGAANFGAASTAAAGLNMALTSSVVAIQTPAASAVLAAEGAVEWGVVRPFTYLAMNPKKIFYKQENSSELNSLGERVAKLHEIVSNTEINIDVRRQAREEIGKLREAQVTDRMVAPVIKKAMPILKEKQDKVR